MDDIKLTAPVEEKALFIADDKKSEGNTKSMKKSLTIITVIYGVLLLLCILSLIKKRN